MFVMIDEGCQKGYKASSSVRNMRDTGINNGAFDPFSSCPHVWYTGCQPN